MNKKDDSEKLYSKSEHSTETRIDIHIFALLSESYTENYIQNTNIQKNYAHLSFARKLSYTRGSSYGRKLIVIQTGSIEVLDIKLR